MSFSGFRRSLKKGGNAVSCGAVGSMPNAVTKEVCVLEIADLHKVNGDVEFIAVLDDQPELFYRQANVLEFSDTFNPMIESKRVVLMAVSVANHNMDERTFSTETPSFGLAKRGFFYQRINVDESGVEHYCLPEWYAYIRLVCSAAVFREYFAAMGASSITSTKSESGSKSVESEMETQVDVEGAVSLGGSKSASRSRGTDDSNVFTAEYSRPLGPPHVPEDLDLFFIREFDSALKNKGFLSRTMKDFIDAEHPTLSQLRLVMSHHDTSERAKSLSLQVASKIGAGMSNKKSVKASKVVNLTQEIHVTFHPEEAFKSFILASVTVNALSDHIPDIFTSTKLTLETRDPLTYKGNIGELSILLVGDVGSGKSSLIRSLLHAQTGVMGEPTEMPAGMIIRTDEHKEGTRYVQQYDLLRTPFNVRGGRGSSVGCISLSDTEGMGIDTNELVGMSDTDVARRSHKWTKAEFEGSGAIPMPKVVPNATWLVFDGHELVKSMYDDADEGASSDFARRLRAYAGFLERFRGEHIPAHPLVVVFTKRDCIERDFPHKANGYLDKLFTFTSDTFDAVARGALSKIFSVANYVPHEIEPGTSRTKMAAAIDLQWRLATSKKARTDWEKRCDGWQAQNDALLRVVSATVEQVRARAQDEMNSSSITNGNYATIDQCIFQ